MRVLRDGRGFDGLLVALALGYLLVFSAFPLVYNVVMSLQEVDLFSLASFDRPFVGLQNYRDVLGDPASMQILRNTVVFVALSVACQLVIGFALALFFQLDFPGAGYLRGVFLAGWIMPALVVGAVWGWILAGDFGVLNHLLMSLGLTEREDLLALRPGGVALRGDPRQHLARGAVQHAAALGRPRRHPGRRLRGGGARRRDAGAAVPHHHAALDARAARRGDRARHHLHAAAVRPFRGAEPGRAGERLERVPVLVVAALVPGLPDRPRQRGLGADDRLRGARRADLRPLHPSRARRPEMRRYGSPRHRDRPRGDLPVPALRDVHHRAEGRRRDRALPADLLAGIAEPAGRRGLDPAADALVHDELGDHRARHHADRRFLRHRLRLCARAHPQPLDGRGALHRADDAGAALVADDHADLRRLQPGRADRVSARRRHPRPGGEDAAALHRALPRHLPAGAARARGGGAGRRQLAHRRLPADQRAAGAQRHPGQLDPGAAPVVRRVRLCPLADRRAGDAAGDGRAAVVHGAEHQRLVRA